MRNTVAPSRNLSQHKNLLWIIYEIHNTQLLVDFSELWNFSEKSSFSDFESQFPTSKDSEWAFCLFFHENGVFLYELRQSLLSGAQCVYSLGAARRHCPPWTFQAKFWKIMFKIRFTISLEQELQHVQDFSSPEVDGKHCSCLREDTASVDRTDSRSHVDDSGGVGMSLRF